MTSNWPHQKWLVGVDIRNLFSKIESSKINCDWRIIRISILWVLIFDLMQNFELWCKIQTVGSPTPGPARFIVFDLVHVWFKVSCLKTCRLATFCDTVCLSKNIQDIQDITKSHLHISNQRHWWQLWARSPKSIRASDKTPAGNGASFHPLDVHLVGERRWKR